jgi:hypothetical protein
VLGLGCSPVAGCSFTTHDRVFKSLIASNPASVIVHNASFSNVSVQGGTGLPDCDFHPIVGSPDYLTIEDSSVSGNVNISDYVSCWLGFIRNSVGGSVTLTNNTLDDPDAMEIVTNTIVGNLACYGNSPAPQIGDSEGGPNVVFGYELGQCVGL